jgi:hypothetical protein
MTWIVLVQLTLGQAILLFVHKTTQPTRLLAQESFRNAMSKLQNIVYGIPLVNHIQPRVHSRCV